MKPLFEQDSRVPLSKRIVFLGDSITDEGTYIAYMDAYFRQHMPEHDMTLINLGVNSETASGLSEPDHPFPRPCIHDRLGRALQESRPDWVVLCYGMNDGIYYPFSEERFQAYRQGVQEVIRRVRQAGALAIVMTPPPFDPKSLQGANLLPAGHEKYSYMTPYAEYNGVLRRYAYWMLTLTAEADGIINIHDPLTTYIESRRSADPAYISGDGIHPNKQGHWIIAKTLLAGLFNITLEREPSYVEHPEQSELYRLAWERHLLLSAAWKEHVGHTHINKVEALPLKTALEQSERLAGRIQESAEARPENRHSTARSLWKGYERIDFYVGGREGFIIVPTTPAAGKPWIWRTEFFDAFPSVDMAMLEQGWCIAYYRLSNMYGCPYAVQLMHRFQSYLVSVCQLAEKTVLFGFSRGGLYAINYSAAYPQSVAALYLDAPVTDIRSWPGGVGSGTRSPREWEECLTIYGMTEESSAAYLQNSLEGAATLAAAGIPIIIVAGDADTAVPLDENAAILERHYRQLNGTVKMIVKPGVGHHPHSLEDPGPVVDFIVGAVG